MKILYSVINLLILIPVVYFLLRKLLGFEKGFLLRAFRERRKKINKELDDSAEAILIAEKTERIMESEEKEAEDRIRSIKEEYTLHAAEKVSEIYSSNEREKETLRRENDSLCLGLRADMFETVRKNAITRAKEMALGIMSKPPYVSLFRKKEGEIADSLLAVVSVTSGNRVYISQKKPLKVVLTSTFALEDEIVEKIRSEVSSRAKKAGGESDFVYKTDSELVGGLKLSVGDTVYDGTISDLLYRMTKRIGKGTAVSDFTAKGFADTLVRSVKDSKMEIGIYQLGRVISISDGICWLNGLADIMYGEVVEFISAGELGMILDIATDRVGCVVFGRYEHIEAGDLVRRAGHMASVPVGDNLLGRVVNPLGAPIDGFGTIRANEFNQIEFRAPAILDRRSVTVPLHTGIKAIDALVPIGRGQRELIIGDRQTGKTSIAIDAIINQKDKGVICIYVAVGQKEITVAEILSKLKKYGAMEYTVIVCADAYSSASMQYIAPFSGTAMGEYFMYKGKDVLIVYDDLSKHAVAYRELSLLLHRPSGREAYPGDVFYLHSRLLERSARLSDENGGGSMTALPIIETQAGDISAYIPTNVISITDGQIFLETELFNAGQRPAINVGLSVSRVGGAVQRPFMRKTVSALRMNLAQYRELEAFAQFGTEIDEHTRKVLDSGSRIMASLNQPRFAPISDDKEALIICAVTEGYAEGVPPDEMVRFESLLFEHFEKDHPELLKIIGSPRKPTDGDMEKIRQALKVFSEAY
ncbi:MAG: F0F1 ATP synthase subunit alpha [Eubacteriales bacterium]